MLPCFHPPLLLAVEAEEKARQDEKQRAIDAREAQADAEQAKRLEERGFVVAKQASSVPTGIVSYRIVLYPNRRRRPEGRDEEEKLQKRWRETQRVG